MKIWRSKFGPPRKLPPCFSITPITRNVVRPILISLLMGLAPPNRPSRTSVPMTQTFFL